eukprot:g2431.t1
MEWQDETRSFYYDCPCGDRFVITEEELMDGETIAYCPSCSLRVKVIYDPANFQRPSEEEEEDTSGDEF